VFILSFLPVFSYLKAKIGAPLSFENIIFGQSGARNLSEWNLSASLFSTNRNLSEWNLSERNPSEWNLSEGIFQKIL
jgi:hypothetical protein